MADATKLKKRRRSLGAPPGPEEASENLSAPEIFEEAPAPAAKSVDGRSLRKKGRTEQLATRVTPEFKSRLQALAQRDESSMVEVLERALDMYEENKS